MSKKALFVNSSRSQWVNNGNSTDHEQSPIRSVIIQVIKIFQNSNYRLKISSLELVTIVIIINVVIVGFSGQD